MSADEPIDLIPTSGSRWSHRARGATAEHEAWFGDARGHGGRGARRWQCLSAPSGL
ncbi:MAG: hypothetical protein MZV49_26150 [Rhodopseudomonas palustris]|nr:hypothetical protein [Rhodopseudomonas palustris]